MAGRRSTSDGVAVVLAAAGIAATTWLLLQVHPMWTDALPGSGGGYATAVLVVAHLPGLALVLVMGSLGPGRLPMWWQGAAALVAFWYLVLVVTTFDLKSGGIGSLESALGYERFAAAAPAARAAGVGALLSAFALEAARTRRRWLLAVPVLVVAPYLLLARDVLVG